MVGTKHRLLSAHSLALGLQKLAGKISDCRDLSGISELQLYEDLASLVAVVDCNGELNDSGFQKYFGAADHLLLKKTVFDFCLYHSRRLQSQGIAYFSQAGLRAFFFSALYETMRFRQCSSDGEQNIVASARRRVKRRGRAYFTPPALAYLAAFRALSSRQAPGISGGALPCICDPAMGTGVYLIAALDYLDSTLNIDSNQPNHTNRLTIAQSCLFGSDLDAITHGIARLCLYIAIGESKNNILSAEFAKNLVWGDGLATTRSTAGCAFTCDVILTNPPWSIVKARGSLSRVNKANIARLRADCLYQGGGDTSYYKLFLERSYHLLAAGGVGSVLVPASFCSDKGATPLRRLLLEQNQMLSIEGFINEDNAFDIHGQFKYCLLTFRKSNFINTNTSFDCRFGLIAGLSRLLGDDINNGGAGDNSNNHALFKYELDFLQATACEDWQIFELPGRVEVDIQRRFYSQSKLLRDLLTEQIFFRREFDMTLDRPKFIALKQNPQPLFIKGAKSPADQSERTVLPLLEGSNIKQFNFEKDRLTNYFLSQNDFFKRVSQSCYRVGFVSISASTNTRSMIAALLPAYPAANSLPTLVFEFGAEPDAMLQSLTKSLFTLAVLNSFCFDSLLRQRLVGNNLSFYLLEQIPFPSVDTQTKLGRCIVLLSAILGLDSESFAAEISLLQSVIQTYDTANSELAKLRQRIWLEVMILYAYNLDLDQAAYILRDCRFSVDFLARRRSFKRAITTIDAAAASDSAAFATDAGVINNWQEPGPSQTSFFRVDKSLEADLRLPNMVLEVFTALTAQGGGDSTVAALLEAKMNLPLPGKSEMALQRRFATATAHLFQGV